MFSIVFYVVALFLLSMGLLGNFGLIEFSSVDEIRWTILLGFIMLIIGNLSDIKDDLEYIKRNMR